MLDFLLNGSEMTELTVPMAITTVLAAVILGLIISVTYIKTYSKDGYSANFVLTLMMIAPIIAIIILLVGSNVARAFSLAGAFSIIRFRSNPGDPKDITYIFFTLAAGLACGVGLIGYAFLFTVILCLVAVLVHFTRFGIPKWEHKTLKINVPEDLNYTDAFDDIFGQYAKSISLERVKSKEMGSVFELDYDVVLKQDCNSKEFFDELRCRNGNLSIVMSIKETE